MARIEIDGGKCSQCDNDEVTTYVWTGQFQTCLGCLTKAQQLLARLEGNGLQPSMSPPPAVPGQPYFSAQPNPQSVRPATQTHVLNQPPQAPPQPTFNMNDPTIKRFEAGIKVSIEEHNGDILGTEVERIFRDINMQRGMERPLAMFLKTKYGFPPEQFMGMAVKYFANQAGLPGGEE